MRKELDLFIERSPYTDSVKIWLMGFTENSSVNYSLGIDGLITEKEVKLTEVANELNPFIQMPNRFASKFIELLISEANKSGLYQKEQNVLEGRLLEKDIQIDFLKAQLEKYVNKSTR